MPRASANEIGCRLMRYQGGELRCVLGEDLLASGLGHGRQVVVELEEERAHL